MNFEKFLKKYTAGKDNKITKQDIKDYVARGGSQNELDKFLAKAKNKGVNVGGKAEKAASKDKTFNTQKSNFQNFLNTYTAGKDNRITKQDIKDYAARGGSQNKLDKFLAKAKDKGVNIGNKAEKAAGKDKYFTTQKDNFKNFLNTYTGGKDNKITKEDVLSYAAQGGDQDKLNKFLDRAEEAGVNVGNKAENAAGKDKFFTDNSGKGNKGGGNSGGGYSGTDIDLGVYETMRGIDWKFADALQTSINNNNKIIETIRGKVLREVTQLETASRDFATATGERIKDMETGRQLEASNYRSDQDRIAKENVARIQGDYGVQMQKIMKAGQEALGQIQGEYSLANTTLSGEYGLESDRIRGNTARDVASRQQNASIFGSLLAGFFS